MATLYTGSSKVLRGIEYSNLSGTGNAMQTTEVTKMSINRSPYAEFPAYTKIFVSETFTYQFEIDTVLIFSNEIEPDFYVTTIEYNTNDINLAANTESANIVTLTDIGNKETTKGDIAAGCYVTSSSNQDESVVIRIYGNTLGLLHTAAAIEILSNSAGTTCLTSWDIQAVPITAKEIVSFTVEGTDSDLIILGSDTPSRLAMQRKNL